MEDEKTMAFFLSKMQSDDSKISEHKMKELTM